MATTSSPSSPAEKGRQTRLINEAIGITERKTVDEARLKAIKRELGDNLAEALKNAKTVTVPTRKGVCELTQVEAVSISDRQVENLHEVLADRFEELVVVEVKHKITPSLRRILVDPGPQEQDLSAAVEQCLDRKLSLRFTFRSA